MPMKKALIWLLLFTFVLPTLAFAQENTISCQLGDVFTAVFSLTADSAVPDAVAVELEYDHDVFEPIPSDSSVYRDGRFIMAIYGNKPVSVSFRVNKFAPSDTYMIDAKVLGDNGKTNQVKITPVQVIIGPAPTSTLNQTPIPKPTNTPMPIQTPTLKPTNTPKPTATQIPDETVEALSLMFSELESVVEKACDDALTWDIQSAPTKLSDFPILPYGWADSVKHYKNIKYSCKRKDGKYVLSLSIPDQILKNIGGLENAQISLWIQNGTNGRSSDELEKAEDNTYYIDESKIQLDGGKIVGFFIFKGQSFHNWYISLNMAVQEDEYSIDCFCSRKKINDQKFELHWHSYNSGNKECVISLKRSKWVQIDYAPNPSFKVSHEMKQSTELYYDLSTLKIKDIKNSGAKEWEKYD